MTCLLQVNDPAAEDLVAAVDHGRLAGGQSADRFLQMHRPDPAAKPDDAGSQLAAVTNPHDAGLVGSWLAVNPVYLTQSESVAR